MAEIKRFHLFCQLKHQWRLASQNIFRGTSLFACEFGDGFNQPLGNAHLNTISLLSEVVLLSFSGGAQGDKVL